MELAEIIVIERAWRCLVKASVPPLAAVRETIRRLLILDDEKQTRAIQLVDSTTAAYLATGALKWHRQSAPDGDLPERWYHVEDYSSEDRQEVLHLAVAAVPRTLGRRRTDLRNLGFAVRLADYYWRTEKKRPTVCDDGRAGPSPFLRFATDAFTRVDTKRRTSGTLIPTLREALRRVKHGNPVAMPDSAG